MNTDITSAMIQHSKKEAMLLLQGSYMNHIISVQLKQKHHINPHWGPVHKKKLRNFNRMHDTTEEKQLKCHVQELGLGHNGSNCFLGCQRHQLESQRLYFWTSSLLRKQWKVVQLFGSTPPTWETHLELKAPGFSRAQPLQPFGEPTNRIKASLPVCL